MRRERAAGVTSCGEDPGDLDASETHEAVVATATTVLAEVGAHAVSTLELGDLVRLGSSRPYRFDTSSLGLFSHATRVEYRDHRGRTGYVVAVSEARGLRSWHVGEMSARANRTGGATDLRRVLRATTPVGAPNADVARTYELLADLPLRDARTISGYDLPVPEGSPLRGLYYPEHALAGEVEGGLRLLAALADGAPLEWLLRHLREADGS